jgi:hypothetical protein
MNVWTLTLSALDTVKAFNDIHEGSLVVMKQQL